MKFSEAWLRAHVNPDISTEELITQLTMAGIEVDGVEPVAPQFSNVVVGEILDVDRHPDADKLSVCIVDNGLEKLQVVCGAHNARPGIKVPFAQVGAIFPELEIEKATLRGVESNGMLCSERELGLTDNHLGLMELALDAPVGVDIREYLDLNDVSVDLDLTPNRSDCLSMVGLARETGLLNSMDVEISERPSVPAVIDDTMSVTLLAGPACSRFAGRIIRDINVKAVTPVWMKERLRRAGIRSIDAVVDITNYVMLELGQPLHAYDYNQLLGSIVVRQSKVGETCILLDGSEVTLHEDTLLITDDSGPVGLAGVMGGLSTSVTDTTESIFLEAAFFSPSAIAGRARSYGMATEAAHRFERGVDWQGQAIAIERATELILEITGGQPGPTTVTTSELDLPKTRVVELRASKISLVLGVDISTSQVEEILTRLGFERRLLSSKDDIIDCAWEVTVPSHRFDVAIEADLIEEISRIYGYNNLPVRTPVTSIKMLSRSEEGLTLNRLRDQLVSRGWFEAITYSFVDAGLQALLDPGQEPIELANPLSSDMSVMRTTIWSGLVKSLVYNINRQEEQVRLFETGLCFSRKGDQSSLTLDNILQIRKLAGVACGRRESENWANSSQLIDFYDVKGDLESIFSLTGSLESFDISAAIHPALHLGQSAVIERNGIGIGYIGLLDPRIQRSLDIKFPIYLFEIETDPVLSKLLPHHSAPSKFPEVRRDIAIIVDLKISASEVRSCINSVTDESLDNLKLFDVYQGEGIDPNRKSLALGLTFRHASRTLTDQEINHSIDAIVSILEVQLGATLRS